MSHKASHWLADIPAGVLRDSDFRVMFHLCDAHNSKRPPETACFPSQEKLREVTGLSNGGLNNSLKRMEEAGLLWRRRTRSADGTKGPTYYILGCDFDAAPPSPQNGDGDEGDCSDDVLVDNAVDSPVDKSASISTLSASPSPHRGTHQLHARGDKPVIEPLIEPVRGAGSIVGPEIVLAERANLIRRHKPFLCTAISSVKARECIEAGLVTHEDCRRAGIQI